MLKEAENIQGQHEHMSEGLPEFTQNTGLTVCACVCWAETERDREIMHV